MEPLDLKELDRLEREMQGKVMSTNVSAIVGQLRPLLDLVERLAKEASFRLPLNTAGNCFYCDLDVPLQAGVGSDEDDDKFIHASSQFPDGHYCLNHPNYEDVRAVLADYRRAKGGE